MKTLQEIIKAKKDGTLAVGETAEVELTNGEKVVLAVAERNSQFRMENGEKADLTIVLDNVLADFMTMTEIQKFLEKDFLELLPAEWRELVVPVLVKTADKNGDILETKHSAFLPSEEEVFGERIYSYGEEGEQFEYFRKYSDRKKGGRGLWYYLRSPAYCYIRNYCVVDCDERPCYYDGVWTILGVRPVICLKIPKEVEQQ